VTKVFRAVADLREQIKKVKKKGLSIGFVPTMGYLHDGHLELIRRCRLENDYSVVSIFVNPIQFGSGEDFERYPRDEASDLKKLEEAGVDAAFIPPVEEMYPEPLLTYVEVERLSEPMCGRFRPGHFRGVATVVAKLFNIVQPDRAYFGKKDYQQLKVIEKMVRDLNFPVEIVPVDTVREEDGLAMSSRNVYLSSDERKVAAKIYRALLKGKEAFLNGERRARVLEELVKGELDNESLFKVQYVEVRDAETLDEIDEINRPAVLAVAVYVGSARLIDNIELR